MKKNNIDIKKRKDFQIWEFFDIVNWKKYPKQERESGNLPLVSTSWVNNWISDYIKERSDSVYENCITVAYSGSVWYTAYQKNEVFVWETVIALLPKFELNDYIALFLVSILNKHNSEYTYEHKIKVLSYWNDYIKLPVDNGWNPDREYMENYMKNLEEKCKTKLQNLILARGGVVRLISTNSWKEFKVWDLFEISSPSPRSQNNYEDWEVPFVASWDVNNWILKYCKPRSGENLDIWNCITVSPVDWSSFYQENDFLGRWWAGSSIMILRNKNLHKYCWLFVAWIIRKCCNFTYNDMWNREKLKNSIVKFPVDSEWNPNRDFMESYMKNLMEKNKEKLKCLN